MYARRVLIMDYRSNELVREQGIHGTRIKHRLIGGLYLVIEMIPYTTPTLTSYGESHRGRLHLTLDQARLRLAGPAAISVRGSKMVQNEIAPYRDFSRLSA